MNIRKTIIGGICLFLFLPLYSQEIIQLTPISKIGVKANLVSYASTTLNIGGEFRLASRYTLDIPISYNPWSFSSEKKIKHVLFQPEARYWFCEAFQGSFIGLHTHGGWYNVSAMGFTDYMKEHRFQGWLVGAGFSYGYQWILSNRLSLEATLGIGFAHMDYEIFYCEKCGEKIKDKVTNYWGPTRAGISLIYILK